MTATGDDYPAPKTEAQLGAIGIFIPDATYDEGDEGRYAERSMRFRGEIESEYGLAFTEENIGAGADWPAYVGWFPVAGWLAAAALGLFFSGKRIQENLDAWSELAGRLSRFFGRQPRFDRNGAAVLAVDAVCKELEGKADSLTLLGYAPLHVADLEDNRVPQEIASITDDVPPLNLGSTVHAFYIAAEDRTFIVLVNGSEITVWPQDGPAR